MRTRPLAIILAISVALNLFSLGVFAARAWQRVEWRHERASRDPAALDSRRPRSSVEPLRWLSDAQRADLRPRRKELRAIRREAEQSLRAESFDSAKFRSTLEALRRETDGIQASVHELLIRQAETSSVAQRRRLADANWARDDTGRADKGPGKRPHEGDGQGDESHHDEK